MKDAGILHGDLLVVDRAAKPDSGWVAVVAVNGQYTVKRLRRVRLRVARSGEFKRNESESRNLQIHS
jgi:SOS-response transcriptional repressor LexA